MIDEHTIGGKPVFILEKHNFALGPWTKYGRLNHDLGLISLDHHTDAHQPFLGWCFRLDDSEAKLQACIAKQLALVDINDGVSVDAAVAKLRYDEQILAALRLGIFSRAFVINLNDSHDTPVSAEMGNYAKQMSWQAMVERMEKDEPHPEEPRRPYAYSRGPDGLYIVGRACIPGCTREPHNDECWREICDAVIDDSWLGSRLGVADEMVRSAEGLSGARTRPYVLDIDLDYFHTRAAMSPQSPELFYSLIRDAEMVTVARESDCVVSLACEGESLTADWLQEKLLAHIKTAVGR